MKKVMKYFGLAILVVGVIWATAFFIKTNNQPPIKYKTISPTRTSIEYKTVATGKVVPEDQVDIKPQITGIIDKILVKEGAIIHTNDLIAKIKVVPSESALNTAVGRVDNAKIVLDNAKIDYDRNKKLFDKGIISAQDFNVFELKYNQAKQELTTAKSDLKIIEVGTAGKGTTNTKIRATVSGTVLEIPVKEGDQVIQANNFNPGTTVATIANLTDMIFEGKVDEAEVSKLKIGMPLKISLGAISNKEFNAKLRFVAPQGVEDQGAVQFKIEANVFLDSNFFVRAGYSANASIILGKKDNVLAIKEAVVQYDEETEDPFVEVETGNQEFERKDIKLGISDGINVEIISGVTEKDKVKIWNKTEPIKKQSKRKKRRR